MALELEWYDLVCFGIVGVAFLCGLWLLWKHEGASQTLDESHETLLAGLQNSGLVVNVVLRAGRAIGHVSATQLWTSCWRGVHPLCLLTTRFFSFVVMAVLLSSDVRQYDATIFLYYTEPKLMSGGEESSEGYKYWLRWQVPVCALILILSIISSSMHIVRAKPQPLYHNHLWIPCWRKLSPMWLLFSRAFAFLCLARLHFDIIAVDGPFSFYFYTQWTFTLVMIYFALGTIISARGCWQYLNKLPLENGDMSEFLRRDLEEKETKSSNIRLQSQYVKEEFNQRVGFWGYLMQITYQISAGAVILTDIVFWCVIVPFLSISHFKLNMSRAWQLMGSMHSLNALFLLLDTALNNLPFPWFRVSYFVLWSCGYITFQWVIHACGFTWWPYPFLELNTPWAPVWYLCLAAFHMPLYGIYSLIVKAKNTILPRFFPRAFLRTY